MTTTNAPPTRKTGAEIEAIVARAKYPGARFRLLEKGDGYLVQLEYDEEDIDTGDIELQRSRKWYVSPFATETEIVDSLFACVQRSMEHRAREHFTYDGERVHSPHFSLSARLQMCREKRFDRRGP